MEDIDSMYPSEGRSPPETIDEEEAEMASKTALVPKAMLPDCKVGEKVTGKVIADHGDELEVELEPTSYKKEPTEMSSDEELDSMSKEY
jgi:hypothetical protein